MPMPMRHVSGVSHGGLVHMCVVGESLWPVAIAQARVIIFIFLKNHIYFKNIFIMCMCLYQYQSLFFLYYRDWRPISIACAHPRSLRLLLLAVCGLGRGASLGFVAVGALLMLNKLLWRSGAVLWLWPHCTVNINHLNKYSDSKQGRKIHQRGACILYDTYLYCILYCICFSWRRPPVTVAAAASAMAPRVLAVHLALGYAQCLTLSSIM
jgi:hypothetical protein